MPKTSAERMATYRQRQRVSGLKTLSLTVPAEDAQLFQELAAERRRSKAPGEKPAPLRLQRFFAADAAQATRDLGALTPSRTNARSTSRAEAVAEKILKRVIRSGWPVGTSLGSEAELMKEFGVSRTVLRQTIRLLTHHGVVRMQRGVGGGLMVDAPDAAATATAVGIYLEFQRIGPLDILETRKILEQATTALAVERLTQAGENRLRADIAAESSLDGNAAAEALQRFHFTVADLCGDPALRLFAGIVFHMSDAHSTFARRPRTDRDAVVKRIKKLHRQIADAMIARDTATACHLMGRYLHGYRDWME